MVDNDSESPLENRLAELNQDECICECPCVSEAVEESKECIRKNNIFNIVTNTESYLKERRIPELIRFLLTKIVAQAPEKPIPFLEKLMDDCMLFRAGHGTAPTLYETRHLQAAIRSFDPGQSGWLSTGQIRRLYASLGLGTPTKPFNGDRVPVDLVLEDMKKTQEQLLLQLLSAGN